MTCDVSRDIISGVSHLTEQEWRDMQRVTKYHQLVAVIRITVVRFSPNLIENLTFSEAFGKLEVRTTACLEVFVID